MENNTKNSECCDKLIERFQSLNYFNTLTAVSIKILSDTLLYACTGQAQAEMLVNTWIAEHADYPKPADINRMAREMNRFTLAPPCRWCKEIPGYVHVTQKVKTGPYEGEERDAVDFCKCPRGDALREGAQRFRAASERDQQASAQLAAVDVEKFLKQ